MEKSVRKAREFAKGVHEEAGHTYGEDSYVVHLDMVYDAVVRFLPESATDTEKIAVMKAAFGHDLLEDTELSYNDVKKELGRFSADIIFSVTDEVGKNRTERMLRTLPKIRNSHWGTFLKMADRYSNGSKSKASGHSLWKRYRKEYVVFRFALKQGTQFREFWGVLDELFEFKEIV